MKKFSKLFAVLALSLVAIFSFAACGGTSIVGDWTLEEFKSSSQGVSMDMKEMGMDLSVTFKDDNKFTMTLKTPSIGTTPSESMTVTGTYEFKDNKLTFKADDEDASEEISGTVPYLEYKDGKLVYEVTTTESGMTISAKIVLKKK